MRHQLLSAWGKGKGNASQARLQARIIRQHIRQNDEAARFHLPVILKIADGPMPVPEANMILYDCYKNGYGVPVDLAKALERLELAVSQGLEMAEWYLASLLLDNTGMPVITQDPDRALAILRRLARKSDDVSAMSLARNTFSSYVAQHFSIHDVSSSDLELITWHANNRRNIRSTDLLPLARFFAAGESSKDYACPRYRLSRELLIAGSQSGNAQVREACDAQLEAWGVKPSPEVAPTTAQKAIETVKMAGMFGGISIVLIFWSAVGLFLMSVAAAINAFTIPIVLGALIVAFIVSRLRR